MQECRCNVLSVNHFEMDRVATSFEIKAYSRAEGLGSSRGSRFEGVIGAS